MLHEDELYTPMLDLYAARVGCIERAFFKRRVREGSIMTNRISRRNMEGYFTAFREMRFGNARIRATSGWSGCGSPISSIR